MTENQMLTPAQTHELLIRLDERTMAIMDKVSTLEAQVGGLCSLYLINATHTEKIEQIENDIETIFDRDKWRKRAIVGTFIALVISTFWRYLSTWFSTLFG